MPSAPSGKFFGVCSIQRLPACSRLFVLLLLACLTQALTLPASDIKHVVLISVDGLRADVLRDRVQANPQIFPGYLRLINEGAFTYNARCDFTYSATIPNHASIVSGRPATQPEGQPNNLDHGITFNSFRPGETLHQGGNPNVDYIASVFDVAHDHGLTTACYVTKTKLALLTLSYDATNGAPDIVGEDNGRAKIDYQIVQASATPGVVAAVTNDFASNAVNFTLLHILEPDAWGHSYGWISPTYDNAIRIVGDHLNAILTAIDSSSVAGSVAVIVTSDHGGGGEVPDSHLDPSYPENYTIPFFVWGAGLPPGSDLYAQLANRYNPGTGFPDYNHPYQPIRNGDAANLALALLGLPPVPGSLMHPQIASTALDLTASHQSDSIQLTWAETNPQLTLERAPTPSGVWEQVSSGITTSNGTNYFIIDPTSNAAGYYRLQNPNLLITEQPLSGWVVNGQSNLFQVTATGTTPLSYQWEKDDLILPNQTNDTLLIPAFQDQDAGLFRVTVSSPINSVTSQPAYLAKIKPPFIERHPNSLTAGSGGSASFFLRIVGVRPYTFQWQLNGVDVLNATNNFLILTGIDQSDAGDYTIIVSNIAGPTTSNPATLTVLP